MKSLFATALLGSLAVPAQAAILVDGSPTGTFLGGYLNVDTGQNFLVRFSLGSASTVTGFDIFTCCNVGAPGAPVTVRIRADAGGSPSGSNLYEFSDTVTSSAAFDANSAISSVDFAGIDLAAGTYWFGVSGSGGRDLSWNNYNNGGNRGPSNQRVLVGNSVLGTPRFYDLAYRVIGTAGAVVPEPATWALLILGFAAVGGAMRRSVKPNAAVLGYAF